MMRIEIPVELLRDHEGNENAELVIKLISFFRQARHEWELSPRDVDAVGDFCRRHVPTLAQVYLLLAQKASGVAHAWAPRGTNASVVRVTRETLEGDVRDLERSAVLVVENATYDWQMIEALARVLGCEDIIDAESRGHLDVYNGGGKDGATRHAVDQAAKFTRTKRVVLVIDSDSFRPGERTNNHKQSDAVVHAGGNSHVLSFREMENYIPNRILARQPRKSDAQADMAKRLESLKRFTAEQRAHFDMKHGFKGKVKKVPESKRKSRHAGTAGKTYHVPPHHGDLYDGVDEQDLITLQEGFGTDLPRLFLQEVQNGGISEKDLDGLQLGATQELRLMLDKVRRVI
ncbi:hypothetical protein [Streptomyces pinistramenti]|uniref:hypothetical protein n=1 Tax=Streptomyces pinistramenti TaxID=2884812 RepID=UPI001D06CE91|nr:hypothetical protein [Streptomyces pinistramenti]MCB5911286.1 hypothetical protein [Streptomyces pinistramenti]